MQPPNPPNVKQNSLLSPLVFTITAFDISLFQVPKMHYPSVQKVQICKMFQGLRPSLALQSSIEWLTGFAHVKTANRFLVLISHPALL